MSSVFAVSVLLVEVAVNVSPAGTRKLYMTTQSASPPLMICFGPTKMASPDVAGIARFAKEETEGQQQRRCPRQYKYKVVALSGCARLQIEDIISPCFLNIVASVLRLGCTVLCHTSTSFWRTVVLLARQNCSCGSTNLASQP